MSWQTINKKIEEIFDLQQQLVAKIQSEELRIILNRNKKYGNIKSSKIRELKNALLEHQIRITPYQMIIFNKVKRLTANSFKEELYINIPQNIESANNYVNELKEKFELAIKSLELIIGLENLSFIENDAIDFSKSVYTRKTEIENNIYLEYVLHITPIKETEFINLINSKIKEFIKTLSVEEKQNLLLEIFTLSYDRNAFDYFNGSKVINILASKKNYTPTQYLLESSRYEIYKQLLDNMYKHLLKETKLEMIYEEFKIIFETEIYKQKVIKK